MFLYRLDFESGEAVTDCFGPVLSRAASTADATARAYAADRGEAVIVSRISGPGHLRAIRRVEPDGRVRRISQNAGRKA